MLGILAGYGRLPKLVLDSALASGKQAKAYVIDQPVPSGFEIDIAAEHQAPVRITRWGEVTSAFANDGVDELVMIGKVDKTILFQNPDFDAEAMVLLQKMKSKSDSDFFVTMSEDLAERGISIVSQRQYASGLIMKPGVYGAVELEELFRGTADYGLEMAKGIAALDIGQTVVAAKQAVLAVEAIEGTDEAIKRGSKLAGGEPIVVCKAARPSQDERFDIPAFGVETLKTMIAAGCKCFAFEAAGTFAITPEEIDGFARENGLCLLAY